MPLHAHHKSIATRILDSLDDTIRRPQFPPQAFNRLMVMAIARRGFRASQLSHDAVLQHPHAVRVAIARRALLVLDGVGMLTDDVLNQSTTARHIQSLGEI